MCEACYAIYPLYDAILQYTIETLVLDANILRDSILVRLEMVALPFTLSLALTRSLTLTLIPSLTLIRILTLTLLCVLSPPLPSELVVFASGAGAAVLRNERQSFISKYCWPSS